MASRKPLVIVAGEVQQLQAGDTLNAPISEVEVVSQVADATLTAGMAVYSSADDHVDKARANAGGTSKVMGLLPADIASSATGSVQTSGILVLTTGEWDAVTGGSGGLTNDTYYYLSAATAGLITATAPSTGGQYVIRVGLAISTTEMKIAIGERYFL